METITKKSKWRKVDICTGCGEVLSNRIVYYNDALCPYCGLNSDGTICDTDEVIYRKVETGTKNPRPWWKLWKPKIIWNNLITLEGKDGFSQKWIEELVSKNTTHGTAERK